LLVIRSHALPAALSRGNLLRLPLPTRKYCFPLNLYNPLSRKCSRASVAFIGDRLFNPLHQDHDSSPPICLMPRMQPWDVPPNERSEDPVVFPFPCDSPLLIRDPTPISCAVAASIFILHLLPRGLPPQVSANETPLKQCVAASLHLPPLQACTLPLHFQPLPFHQNAAIESPISFPPHEYFCSFPRISAVTTAQLLPFPFLPVPLVFPQLKGNHLVLRFPAPPAGCIPVEPLFFSLFSARRPPLYPPLSPAMPFLVNKNVPSSHDVQIDQFFRLIALLEPRSVVLHVSLWRPSLAAPYMILMASVSLPGRKGRPSRFSFDTQPFLALWGQVEWFTFKPPQI